MFSLYLYYLIIDYNGVWQTVLGPIPQHLSRPGQSESLAQLLSGGGFGVSLIGGHSPGLSEIIC